ncbi:MAG TPA: quinol:electron acceptor oxidoreductase subunit ActD [Ignavibacteriales bacterium]|nr:quinol:electron acceptor oxidoreductase subunit ActD [Ignavibacteriales bacterium]
MDKNLLFAVTALFDTPGEIIHAARAVREAGYTNYDVNTPYPVHGMDSVMKLKPSTLSYVALVLGLTGAFAAIFFMWWVSAVNYPLVIGGKPYFSLPAFIPITFEVTVLLASIGTVVAMLFIYFKLPNNSYPLHDTDYMRSVSSDKFGIVIMARDPMFDEEKITALFKDMKAGSVASVYFDPDEIGTLHRAIDKRFLGFLAAVFIITAAATYFSLNYILYWQPFNWMAEQWKVTAQSKSTYYSDGFGMRMPVEGTVARGFMPFLYKGNQAAAAKYMANPLVASKEVLAKGQDKFNTFCSPCHGYFGKGDSRLRGQFPAPPSLQSEKVRNYKDGDIYYIITEGQNIMPSYAKQITREERWAIIHYIRALQRSQNAGGSEAK